MKAMIFAAGLGTRLRPLTDDRPKALVEVEGKPLLRHTVENLQRFGFNDFVINVHHFAGKIETYLKENDNLGVNVALSKEETELLDTGGGIKFARPLLEGDGKFLIHNVDILSNLDISAMCEACPADAISTLLVSERETTRYFLFDDDGRLCGWTNLSTCEVKSPFGKIDPAKYNRFAFAGVHCVSDRIFPLMEDWPAKFSIVDFYLQAAKENPIYAYVQTGLELIDVGKIETLGLASDFIRRRR